MNATAIAATVRWSDKQDAIFEHVVNETSNVVVLARAGTGKTTTIVEAVIRYSKKNPTHRIIVCAFNKKIAEELSRQFLMVNVRNVEVKTLHALGFACVRNAWSGIGIEKNSGDRVNLLLETICGATVPDHLKKLAAKLCTKGREMAPHATKGADLVDIALQFECEPDDTWAASGFDLAWVCETAVKAIELAATRRDLAQRTGIDFADMLFLPVRNRWMAKVYNTVVVDEAQDMTITQLELALGVTKDRAMLVGDDRQAIYAFRGADSESLGRLQVELNAVQFPLNITYRCGKAIVREAQRLVPDFEAGPDNHEGEVLYLAAEKLVGDVANGDFILSRLNAPLVSIAMSLLRSGKRARIAGRDIGAGLKALVRKLAKGAAASSIPAFLGRVTNWEDKEVTRWTAAGKLAKVDMVRDQADMLKELGANADSVRHLEERIEALFTDDGLGQAGIITCSSVHRAKGLQANRVYVLRSTLYPHGVNREEENIEYVAITRAKNTLVWVGERKATVQEV